MTTLREAAQMALDALDSDNPDIQLRAATHLRAALAQPEQEPVAWRKKWEGDEDYTYYWMNRYKGSEPLYTAPPQREWQGLTEMEVLDICNFAQGQNGFFFVREVEAKLKEKNT